MSYKNSLSEIILDKTFAQKFRASFTFLALPKLISQQGYPRLKFIQYYLVNT